MSELAIRVDKIGKRYRVGERESYVALRDVIARALTSAFKRAPRDPVDYLWAVRDVTFDVQQGEVVGLIGRNGAGKSTLLKLLARITRPTEGWAEIHGRVGSLLEVGTGFHPELTGRENVYLSGAILGMKKLEITRKFNEIVAFAEVERFLDTPLKHYSSGMQMRLAFAVAAHLEPEILLVDEVLSVGDMEFQKKCLGKMGEVAHAGRTILFVSHNLSAVNTLCPRSVLVDGGNVVLDAGTPEVLAAYHARSAGAGTEDDLRNRTRTGTGKAIFTSLAMRAVGTDGNHAAVFSPGCDLVIEVEIEARSNISGCYVAVVIYDSGGYRLVDINTAKKAEFLTLRAGEIARVRFLAHDLLLKAGTYMVGLWLGRDWIEEVDFMPYVTTLEVAPHSDSSDTAIEFPGPYACRFESTISTMAKSAAD